MLGASENITACDFAVFPVLTEIHNRSKSIIVFTCTEKKKKYTNVQRQESFHASGLRYIQILVFMRNYTFCSGSPVVRESGTPPLPGAACVVTCTSYDVFSVC